MTALPAGCNQGSGQSDDARTDDMLSDDGATPLDAYQRPIWGEYDSNDPYQNPARVPAEELVAACMAEAGFEYHPMVEQPTYVHIFTSLPVTADVADATCREESGYNRIHHEVTIEYEQDFVDRWREEFDAWVAVAHELRE